MRDNGKYIKTLLWTGAFFLLDIYTKKLYNREDKKRE